MAKVRNKYLPLPLEGCTTDGVIDAVTPSRRLLFDVVYMIDF